MRTIEPTSAFKRDFKREAKGRYGKSLQTEFPELIQRLAEDLPLEARFRDHALAGEWKDHRDCHVRPDLILIYRKPDDETLQLVRLGSHSELGL
jgi:mRNA interferase YafQ